MKKTIYFLLTLLVLNFCNCYGVFGGTLKDVTASCTYGWYGAGGHQSGVGGELTVQGFDLINSSGKWVSTIRAIPYFNHRMFVDNWIVVPETTSNNQTFTLKTEPTEQNFKYDSFFKLQKANGLTNIWSASGCFDWYKLPINPSTGKPYSQRKTACYDPRISPTDSKAWLDLAHLCKLIALHYKDTELLDYIQVLNEWDFRWNVPYILKPQEYAVGFRMCYNAIRSVSPKQGIMIGATLTADIATAKLLMRSIDSVFILNGETPPRDIVYTVNNYIRTNDSNQGSGVAATPESVDRYNTFFKPLNDFCKSIGIKYAITETGYNSSPSNSASALKNKAPSLDGYSLEEAQGILDLRIILQNASLSECIMVCLYHCKDGYEAEPFTYHGLNYDKDFGGKTDWSAKPARTIIEAYLSEFGKRDIQNFRQKDNYYGVDLIASTDTITLVWTDRNKSGEYDAKPRIGKLTTPNQSPLITLTSPVNAQVYTAPATVVLSVNASDSDGNVTRVEFKQNGNLIFTDTQYPYTHTVTNLQAGTYTYSITAIDNSNLFSTIGNISIEVNPATTTGLTVVNNRLYLNGNPFKINEANSPESRLRDLNYAELDQINACGINTLYATLFGGDITSIHPFINRSNPTQFDEVKVNSWVAYFNHWLSLSPDNILHLLLSEKENHYELSEANHKAMISYFANKFRAFEGRIIYDREELDQNKQAYINTYYSYLKQVAPLSIRAMHNNTNQNPWAGFENSDLIQFLSLQEWQGNFNNRIRSLTASGNWAAYASEVTGGIATHPSCSTLVNTLATAGGEFSSGAGYFISSKDHAFPNFQSQYCGCYSYGASLMGGAVPPDTTTNPPTTQYTLNYATNSTKQPNNTLQGASLSAGKIWVYIDVNSDIPNRPLKFYYDNVFVNNENSRPYELGGGNGYTVTDGQYTVRVDNSDGTVIAQATFTVGYTLPPDTIPTDTVIIPPVDTSSLVVEYSTQFSLNPSDTLVNGSVLPIGGMWFGVKTGTGTHNFSLKKGNGNPDNFTDNSAPFQFKANWLQSGSYTLTISNGSVNKIITFTVQ